MTTTRWPLRRRTRSGGALVVCALALVLAAACDDGTTSPPPHDSTDADDAEAALVAAVATQGPAVAPFEGLGVVEVMVGDERLSVVVADDPIERSDGLRGRTDPSPYDGMLFVHPSDSTTSFTMRGVHEPLELAFYDAVGERVGGHALEPCPQGPSCPSYTADAPWRYALETPPGELPGGSLRPVTS